VKSDAILQVFLPFHACKATRRPLFGRPSLFLQAPTGGEAFPNTLNRPVAPEWIAAGARTIAVAGGPGQDSDRGVQTFGEGW
jgi:hypothetical protein